MSLHESKISSFNIAAMANFITFSTLLVLVGWPMGEVVETGGACSV